MLLQGTNIEGKRAIGLAMLEAVKSITDAVEREYGVLSVPDPNVALVGADRFGERLRSLCAKTKLPRDVLADTIGVSVDTMRLWQNGERYPSYWSLVRVAAYFHVTPNWLITGEA